MKKIILSMSIMFLITSIMHAKPLTKVTIFVHGAVAPGAILFSPVGLIKQHLSSKTWYGKIAGRVRSDNRMRQDWPLLDEAMIEVSPEILDAYHQCTLKSELGKYAAYQLVGAYDHFQHTLEEPSNTSYRYFFYGHNGLLNEAERQKAGIDLYEKIVALQTTLEPKYDVTFTIVGHSHGGTVGLYTLLGEQQQHHNLHIDNLIFLGTPLQKEHNALLTHPMFENIVNFYTLGDKMQTKDFISTSSRASYAKLKDVIGNKVIMPGRYDVQLRIAGDDHAVTHHTLWLLGKHHSAISLRFGEAKKRIKQIFDLIDPLPIAAFCPLMLQALKAAPLDDKTETIHALKLNFAAADDENDVIIETDCSCVRNAHVDYVTLRARTLWQPYAICSEMYKHTLILGAAWHTLVKGS